MSTLGEFLSREAGQKRRARLDDTLNQTMRYFLGPVAAVKMAGGDAHGGNG